MTCLHRYFLKEFVRYFLVIQVLILVIFVFIDYLTRIDKFLESRVSLIQGLWYVLLKLPFMGVQLTPAAILLAAIVVCGLMNRHNELTALKSSGISIFYLVRPALLASGVLMALMFFFGETVIPMSMARSNYIRRHDIGKQDRISRNRNDIWIKSENTLVHINFFDPVQKTVSDICTTTLGEGFRITHRVDARHGRYELGQWLLEQVIEQTLNPDTGDYDVTLSDMKLFDLPLVPEDMDRYVKRSDEMSFFELKAYVAKVRQEGYDPTTYQVDMHGKIAFPFICIIMALTGTAAGMRRFAKANLPAAVALGVVVAFFYWVLYGLCLSMGYAGVLPAAVAPWVTTLFFLVGGLMFLVTTE